LLVSGANPAIHYKLFSSVVFFQATKRASFSRFFLPEKNTTKFKRLFITIWAKKKRPFL
jgi:hypothetical protein